MLNDPSPTSHAPDLSAEANHRVANSLSALAALIRRQHASLPDDPYELMPVAEVRELLGGLRARVASVARLHRMLANVGGAQVDLGAYLQPITSELVSSLTPPGTCTLHFACELGCRLEADRALYLGLIVVELVTNAIKYAHPAGAPGTIAVQCRRDPGGIEVSVRDDGVGLPKHLDAHPGGRGLDLVLSMAAQIEATATVNSSDLGLEWVLRLPSR